MGERMKRVRWAILGRGRIPMTIAVTVLVPILLGGCGGGPSSSPSQSSAPAESAQTSQSPSAVAPREVNLLSLDHVLTIEPQDLPKLVAATGLTADADYPGTWSTYDPESSAVPQLAQYKQSSLKLKHFAVSFKSSFRGREMSAADMTSGNAVEAINYVFRMDAEAGKSHDEYAQQVKELFGVADVLSRLQENGTYELGKCSVGGRPHYWVIRAWTSGASTDEVVSFTCVNAEELTKSLGLENNEEAVVDYYNNLDPATSKTDLGYLQ